MSAAAHPRTRCASFAARARGRPRGRPRAGFAMLEAVVAMALLGAALLAFASFGQRFAARSTRGGIRLTASDLAADRLETAKLQPAYAALDTLARTETTVAGWPGYRRVTVVRRTQTATADYRTVTVLVTHPALAGDSVRKTTIVASF